MRTTRERIQPDVALQLLSPQDVADMLIIPVSTLYNWRYKGAGPKSYRVGRHLRYKTADVLEWLENQS